MGIAKHYETGEGLPEEIYQKLLAARTFRAGSLSIRQVCSSVLHCSLRFYLKIIKFIFKTLCVRNALSITLPKKVLFSKQ